MTSQPSDPDDGGSEDAAPGRTAFDALNPYGDFGGSEPSSGRLLLVVIVFLVAVSGAVVVGGLWAKDAFDAHARQEKERLAKEERQPEAPAAAGATSDTAAALDEPPPASEEPPPATDEPPSANDEAPSATDEPPSANDEAPSASNEPPSASDEPPSASDEPPSDNEEPPSPNDEPPSANDEPPSARSPPAEDIVVQRLRAPPPPPPGLFLRVSRDRSDAETEGLEMELKQGFLERLVTLAPDTPVKTSARPQPGDLDVKLVLRRLERASGRSAHDVTASCAAGIRPPDALPRGRADAQGKAQGPEAGPALAKLAARRCGAFLAEQIAPVARSLN